MKKICTSAKSTPTKPQKIEKGLRLNSENILQELQNNYKQLSKTLPSDIQKLEEEIKEEESRIKVMKDRLEQYKRAMQNLPEMWSLDEKKTESEKATEMMHTGQVIRALREKRGWSQKTLGAKVKKAQAEISRYERTGNIPEPVLVKMASALNTTKDAIAKSLPN